MAHLTPWRLRVLALASAFAAVALPSTIQESGLPTVTSFALEAEPMLRTAIASLATGESPPPASADPDVLSSTPGAAEDRAGDLGWFPTYPLPDGDPPPLVPGSFGTTFSAPLPGSPVWNPPGPKRVGLQAGHWMVNDVPYELRRLSAGASGGGWQEWEVSLLLARRTAALLEAEGVEVDVLPTTIPTRYRAHLFLSIHLDGDLSGQLNGYKIARPGFSAIPATDDELVRTLYREYGAVTGMARDSDAHISRRMTSYYAFNMRRYQHALDLGTPAAIIETGFLTNARDRAFLTGEPDVAARGIANGVLRFLAMELGAAEWGRHLAPASP